MLYNCTWNKQSFNCCDAFLPVETEFGVCYIINSIHTRLFRRRASEYHYISLKMSISSSPKYGLQLISNRALGPGKLQFTAYEDIAIHLHSPHDVPYTIDGDIKETILYGSVKEIVVSVIEMTNDLSTRELPIETRKCRFYWELTNAGIEALYNHYSHSTCTVECSRFAQLKFCNCTHHLMPRNWRDGNVTCDYKGLTCLTDNFSKL